MTKTTERRVHQPPALDDLIESRSDFEDVDVESLGGRTLRLYALSGTDRAKLMSTMVDLADIDPENARDPETVMRVFHFQIRVVAASLGYPEDQWEAFGQAVGEGVIGQLFDVASRLSGMGADAQDEAVQRLRTVRSVASGTD